MTICFLGKKALKFDDVVQNYTQSKKYSVFVQSLQAPGSHFVDSLHDRADCSWKDRYRLCSQ